MWGWVCVDQITTWYNLLSVSWHRKSATSLLVRLPWTKLSWCRLGWFNRDFLSLQGTSMYLFSWVGKLILVIADRVRRKHNVLPQDLVWLCWTNRCGALLWKALGQFSASLPPVATCIVINVCRHWARACLLFYLWSWCIGPSWKVCLFLLWWIQTAKPTGATSQEGVDNTFQHIRWQVNCSIHVAIQAPSLSYMRQMRCRVGRLS